jgi:copper chaperone
MQLLLDLPVHWKDNTGFGVSAGRRATAVIGGNRTVGTAVVSVPEISCAACKTAIEGALKPLDGVRTAVVDIAAKRVSVDFDEALICHDALIAAIENQGYAVAANG